VASSFEKEVGDDDNIPTGSLLVLLGTPLEVLEDQRLIWDVGSHEPRCDGSLHLGHGTGELVQQGSVLL
jgi:hypothetical protein